MNRVIVSLTSFPEAINFAAGAIKSILDGSVLPDKIILYLTLSQFGNKTLPQELLELERKNEIFEIHNYDNEIRSYRKLIPALMEYPNDIIVTIDDDVKYHRHMLKKLLDMHRRFPDHVIAHRAKKLLKGLPYKKWPKHRWYHFIGSKFKFSPKNIQTGVGGVLYPPGVLKSSMIDQELFTNLAPTTDDLWFWAATVLNDRMIIPVPFGYNKPKSLGKPRELSLKTINFKNGEDRNVRSLNNILSAFPELESRISNG